MGGDILSVVYFINEEINEDRMFPENRHNVGKEVFAWLGGMSSNTSWVNFNM